jgi:hypothetical protein
LALVLAMAVTGISIIGYVTLSVTVNALPPLHVYPGWLAVLEPVTELSGEQVQLEVQSDAVGSHPLVSYAVAACGPHPYTADLVIGGSARLTGIQPYPAQFAGLLPPLRVQRLPDLVLDYGGTASNYGPVQLIHVSLQKQACVPSSEGQGANAFTGAAEGVAGHAGAPLQQSWSGPWGWWRGPHAVQAWPLVGALPQITAYGAFTGLAGLSGLWVRPDANIEISAQDEPLNLSIDSAIPAPSDPEVASWTGTNGMNPVARMTDTSSLALLQDWIVVFAVGLGVGGGMLASLLFEWLRPRPEPAAEPPRDNLARRTYTRPPGPAGRRTGHRTVMIAALLIIAWARTRRTGRH